MDYLKLFSDGASFNNPGPSGAGGVILDSNQKEIESYSIPLGFATNNEAEYKALIIGLEKVLKFNPCKVDVFLDSQLLVFQLTGKYKIKNKRLKPLFKKVKLLAGKIPEVNFYYIPREENKKADNLAKKAAEAN